MNIQKLVARHIRIPLRKPIKHASHERRETDNLLMECHLGNGIVGYGEGVPRDYVTGETIASALAVLQKNDLSPLKISPASFEEAIRAIESWNITSIQQDDARGISTHAVRCAVELAWLDAWGHYFQKPLSSVTNIIAPELFQPRDRIQYSVAITSATGFKLAMQAMTRRWFGFKQCKVKVGIAGQNDVARLRTIRKYMGSGMELRLDANEAWKVDEVAEHWEQLSPFQIRWVEQPVLHEEIGKLARIRAAIPMPVMLDESLCGMADAQQCVQERWGDLFNLRLSKCGGFIRTLKLAQFAQQHRLGLQLGCQVGETAVLSAAGRHFACSVKGLLALEGSYDRWLVKESLGMHDITFGVGGKAAALNGPGLGIQIHHDAVERVTQSKVVILG
ncbi:MAG: dipeptide epimerase [Planctomycetia bacterium]|nr:dipeptide epimerase [Planctomycetia bacterium]